MMEFTYITNSACKRGQVIHLSKQIETALLGMQSDNLPSLSMLDWFGLLHVLKSVTL